MKNTTLNKTNFWKIIHFKKKLSNKKINAKYFELFTLLTIFYNKSILFHFIKLKNYIIFVSKLIFIKIQRKFLIYILIIDIKLIYQRKYTNKFIYFYNNLN